MLDFQLVFGWYQLVLFLNNVAWFILGYLFENCFRCASLCTLTFFISDFSSTLLTRLHAWMKWSSIKLYYLLAYTIPWRYFSLFITVLYGEIVLTFTHLGQLWSLIVQISIHILIFFFFFLNAKYRAWNMDCLISITTVVVSVWMHQFLTAANHGWWPPHPFR